MKSPTRPPHHGMCPSTKEGYRSFVFVVFGSYWLRLRNLPFVLSFGQRISDFSHLLSFPSVTAKRMIITEPQARRPRLGERTRLCQARAASRQRARASDAPSSPSPQLLSQGRPGGAGALREGGVLPWGLGIPVISATVDYNQRVPGKSRQNFHKNT